MKKLIKYLLYILPACLMLSYHPVMRLGESESMYFEYASWLFCAMDVRIHATNKMNETMIFLFSIIDMNLLCYATHCRIRQLMRLQDS